LNHVGQQARAEPPSALECAPHHGFEGSPIMAAASTFMPVQEGGKRNGETACFAPNLRQRVKAPPCACWLFDAPAERGGDRSTQA